MTFVRGIASLKPVFCAALLIFVGLPTVGRGATSPAAKHKGAALNGQPSSVPALMVSDIHFDPFHDPAKVQQLVSAPVKEWSSILSAPPALNQRQAFATLQQNCHARGVDTSYTLLTASLRAMQARQHDAKFMTVSGDLIAHKFSCRYASLFPDSTQTEYADFVLKTIRFVMTELRASFPNVPIYAALGNNDSSCGDYRLDTDSNFLARTGETIAEGLPRNDRRQAMKQFTVDGSYSVVMAAPMRNTRLIVLDDIFLSRKYHTCGGAMNDDAADRSLAWLQSQLKQARRSGQRVWILGHIPTGIDPYSTAIRFRDVCGKSAPVMFLSSSKLPDLMVQYGDIIRLAIFAHTHMDEIRLLEPGNQSNGSAGSAVAMKLVPSISPVDGNDPSFTVARVDVASALLKDYAVISASNHTGVGTVWSREYDYRQSFQKADFSPEALKAMVANFRTDPEAKTDASQQYIRHYYIGDRSPELKPFWPQYVCSLSNYTAKSYAACVCSSAK